MFSSSIHLFLNQIFPILYSQPFSLSLSFSLSIFLFCFLSILFFLTHTTQSKEKEQGDTWLCVKYSSDNGERKIYVSKDIVDPQFLMHRDVCLHVNIFHWRVKLQKLEI